MQGYSNAGHMDQTQNQLPMDMDSPLKFRENTSISIYSLMLCSSKLVGSVGTAQSED